MGETTPPPFTPGPWRAEFGEDGGYDCMFHAWRIVRENRQRLAEVDLSSYGQRACDSAFRSPEADANAHLIAAAPDLYAACRSMLRVLEANQLDPVDEDSRSIRELAEEALAKADGR